MPKRVLVANRAEIACRIIHGCRDFGCEAVAVYSDADRQALHVRLADRAVHIGESSPSASYLNQDAVIDAAISTGCDALHPGYGFLSENAGFAQRVIDSGLGWIGPPPSAIHGMGLKIESRETARQAGVPVVPGFEASAAAPQEEADRQLLAGAESVGYPLLVKASAGGGGKGMRLVRDPSRLAEAIAAARREAQGAFGNPSVYLERYIERPHHIEIQLLADKHGNVIHLGERECSIQRRHQKIIEESPSPMLTAMGESGQRLRETMGASAIAVAKAVGYQSAGTVEFIAAEDGSYYFLEMNTRLQVEHPVTELTYGVDLVGWQLRIVDGQQLKLPDSFRLPRGHAIEARICAEDPQAGFLPQTGRVNLLRRPGRPGVRLDSALYEGLAIGPDYDSLLAKLIVYGENRPAALARLRQSLDDVRILGVPTNLSFLQAVAACAAFESGETDTGFIEQHLPQWSQPAPSAEFRVAAVLAEVLGKRTVAAGSSSAAGKAGGPWEELAGWSNTSAGTAGSGEV